MKESIFLVEARESQKELIRVAAANAEKAQSPPPQPLIKEKVLDVEKVRLDDAISTATSLASLQSTMADYQQNGVK